MATNFFLYARKSTDTEEKQILSIEAQLIELRQFAEKERLHIIEEFTEAKTTKVPGRPVFNEMIGKTGNMLCHFFTVIRQSGFPIEFIEFMRYGEQACRQIFSRAGNPLLFTFHEAVY